MPRRKKPYAEGHYQKQSYRPRDNTKLKIIYYLNSQRDGAIRNAILYNANLPSQQWTNFGDILNELVDLEWITEVPISSKMYICKITDRGKEVIKKTREIIEQKHPLKDLDAFNEIIQI